MLVHDPRGLDYAAAESRKRSQDTMLLLMRVFEKPRTTTGWKGYINDPYMDDSFKVNEGMEKARQFLLDVCELGLPTATEALDPISPQYLGDLIAWTAIGARTTESQTHREMSSGLSTPVGFKNGTDGDISIAVNAILSSAHPHSFWASMAKARRHRAPRGTWCMATSCCAARRPSELRFVSICHRRTGAGKASCRPTCGATALACEQLQNPELQPLVMADVVNQIRQGNRSLVGVMIESNIVGGNQKIPQDLSQLTYGCSVTDGCIDWDTTATMLRDAHAHLVNRPA